MLSLCPVIGIRDLRPNVGLDFPHVLAHRLAAEADLGVFTVGQVLLLELIVMHPGIERVEQDQHGKTFGFREALKRPAVKMNTDCLVGDGNAR